MEIININKDNIDEEHICCAIGNDKINKKRADLKKNWLKARFNEGLIFKRFNERGKFFIEYMPIENIWKPVIGKNYMGINCLWVAGKYQKQNLGKKLLDECIKDSKKLKKDGIFIITSKKKKGFLTNKTFFEKYNFKTSDKAYPDFELMILKFNEKSKEPKFNKNAKEGLFKNKKDFSIIYSNQCPFTEEYSKIMSDIIKKRKHTAEIIKLENKEEAQKIGSPFGSFGIYYKGKFIHHEIMPEKKFEKFLDKII